MLVGKKQMEMSESDYKLINACRVLSDMYCSLNQISLYLMNFQKVNEQWHRELNKGDEVDSGMQEGDVSRHTRSSFKNTQGSLPLSSSA